MFGSKETKEEKNTRQTAELMARYGLDTISEKDRQSIQNIINDLAGSGLMKAGVALSFGKAEDQLKIGYLSALVEQNWIIIRQLDRLNKALEK